MRKIIKVAATSQALSRAAMEEAIRMGQRDLDLEHLLLALTLDSHTAGHVLRRHGMTMAKTRGAIAGLRAQRTQQPQPPRPGVVKAAPGEGHDWTARARKVLAGSAGGKKSGDSAAVLRELLHEPSGTVAELLQHAQVPAAELLRGLDDAGAESTPHGAVHDGHGAAVLYAFVPADVGHVWQLLVAPANMPQWDPFTGSVSTVATQGRPVHDPAGSAARRPVPGDVWMAFLPERWPQGKPVRVRPGYGRRRVELLAADPTTHLAWRFTYPDAPKSVSRELAITLTPVPGGSQLSLTLKVARHSGWRRLPGLPLSALRRFGVGMQLRHYAEGISRAFRQDPVGESGPPLDQARS